MKIYKDILTDVFYKMQASRNPEVIGNKNNGYSFETSIGNLSFLALDLRSHRNIKGGLDGFGIMISEEHKRELKKRFTQLQKKVIVDTVFIISPVTIARMGGKIEKAIGKMANSVWDISWWLTRYYNKSWVRTLPWFFISMILFGLLICSCCWLKALFLLLFIFSFLMIILEATGFLDELAGLDDDINDAWSSEINARELHWLAIQINQLLGARKKVVILSGDIHTGGLTYLNFDKGIVSQVTSSPISCNPMSPLVERLTSGFNKIQLPEKDSVCEAENIFFKCKRNFVLCKTYTENSKKRVDVEFYFENFYKPIKFYDI
jgi:hypothetical protein